MQKWTVELQIEFNKKILEALESNQKMLDSLFKMVCYLEELTANLNKIIKEP